MGYNLKTTLFELDELDKGGIGRRISAIFGSNNSLQGHNTELESIVDLKLGSSGDIGEGLTNSFKEHKASLMDPFPSTTAAGSSKRARTPTAGAQVVSCLVDGCHSDLSKCRDYHRRHKVCEMHSKTPRVTIGGHEQRFCQQCSRFHSLGEFDEGKRSCRKRLEGHNRRRRKPQPEPLPVTVNHGKFPSASQGTRFLPLSNQPIIPASSSVMSSNTTWSGVIKNENNPSLYNSSVSASYLHAYNRGRQFPFSSQRSDSSFTGASSAGQIFHHEPNSASGNGGSNNNNNNNGTVKLFCNGLNQVIHSDRALSLLSSSPADTCEMGLGRVIHPSPINPSRPIISGLHYNSRGQYLGPQSQALEAQPGTSALISNLRSSDSLCQDVFRGEPDASSTSGGHQTLSFSWE